MLRNQRGITLVALVVTIVVLIILATISISVALNGGLINKTESAKKWQANAVASDKQLEANLIHYIDTQANAQINK